jgi:hypothetical protein
MSFQNLIRLSQIPCLIMTMSTKCQKNEKKKTTNVINMIRGYDIYDRFTMEHFPLRPSMILTTSFFFARDSICHSRCFGIRGGHGKSAFKLAVKLSVE